MNITATEAKNLYLANTTTHNGITTKDIHTLVAGGDIDTDDLGIPTEDMWAVLADQINS